MVLTALFVAIIIAMAFIPYLGYIPLGFMNATTIHIPVILGALFLGPKRGAFLGGVFGLTSMINNTFINPSITSFVFSPFYSIGQVHGSFSSIIVCFVPRIMIGVVAYYVFRIVSRAHRKSIQITISWQFTCHVGTCCNIRTHLFRNFVLPICIINLYKL